MQRLDERLRSLEAECAAPPTTQDESPRTAEGRHSTPARSCVDRASSAFDSFQAEAAARDAAHQHRLPSCASHPIRRVHPVVVITTRDVPFAPWWSFARASSLFR